jgi:hypothetical protein
MEADDLGTYVVKFSGAGQGRRTLVAEVICAGLARAAGLFVPDLVAVDVDPALADGEPDPEVQDLLKASPGLNLGADFLPGALDFDVRGSRPDGVLAGRVLWFDAVIGNVDRSWRNPNMLFWHGRLALIDHGAALTFHHRWSTASAWTTRPYDAREHAVLGLRPDVEAADRDLAPLLGPEAVAAAVADVPEEWLEAGEDFADVPDVRAAYRQALNDRIAARTEWLPTLVDAVRAGPGPRTRGRSR